MVPRDSCRRRSPYSNLPVIDFIENELARDPGLVEGLHSSNISHALPCNPTPGPPLVPTLIPAPAPAPVPIDEFFKQFMKAYLELNQESR